MASLSSPRPEPDYECKQNELYSIALMGWKSFMDQQPEFEAYNTLYTAAYGAAMRDAVMNAKQMPDNFQRRDVHKTLRTKLKAVTEHVLIKWQQLDSFIQEGFAEANYESKKLAAGYAYYNAAANDDWKSADSLLGDATTFISEHIAALTSGGMPATFEGEFGLLKTSFETLYEEFTDAEQDGPEQTDAKLAANNELHKNLMKMFKDGKKIFRHSAAVKQRFIFTHLLKLISGGSVAQTTDEDALDLSVVLTETGMTSTNLRAADDVNYMRMVKDGNGVTIRSG
jgi:hypothetical protein